MVVGITGGIGSGKSTVVHLLKEMGDIAVYNADLEAKELMNTSVLIRKQMLQAFGQNSYTSAGLNRNFIADLVFGDATKLAQLNAIVHPEVYLHFKDFIAKNRERDYILYENAILFENHSEILCDFVIFIKATTENRIARVMKRDNVSKEQVLARMNSQWFDAKKEIQAHYIIENNDLKSVQNQIVSIHKKLTNKPVSN